MKNDSASFSLLSFLAIRLCLEMKADFCNVIPQRCGFYFDFYDFVKFGFVSFCYHNLFFFILL